jgi:hypothetical protein
MIIHRGDKVKSQAQQEADLNAIEASYISVIGYIPKDTVSNDDWAAMLHRNEMSRGTYAGENRHPRDMEDEVRL